MIEISQLTFFRGDKKIIDNLDVNFKENEITAVIGPNGAGKTTLINLISGFLKDFDGTIKINGNEIKNTSVNNLAKVRAIVPQFSTLNLPFTVYDVVLMGRNPYEKESQKHEDHHIVMDSLESANVLHLKDRIFTELSGGEKQRVQFAKALSQISDVNSNQIKYLILDEPTSSLDPGESRRMMQILNNLVNDKLSIILIAHDLNLASEYSEKILMLKDGKKFNFGKTSNLINKSNLDELYESDLRVTEDINKHFKIIY